MSGRPVSLEIGETTATPTLADPDRRNVLSRDMVAAIVQAVAEAEESPARALLVAASGPAFCAGAELDTLESAAEGDFDPVVEVYEAFLRVRRARLLTIAVVEGPAVGAGFNLALACDLRVAGPRARFESRFAQLRLHPGGAHLRMLQQAVGEQDALRLALLGAVWDAATALERGLVTAVDEDPRATAAALAAPLAELPKPYVERVLATARRSPELATFDEALALETDAQRWSATQPEFIEGLAAIRAALSRS